MLNRSPRAKLALLTTVGLVAMGTATVSAAPAPRGHAAAFGDQPPVVSKLKVAPLKFKALASGGATTLKGGGKVSFSMSDAGHVIVSYRRATAKGYVAVKGSFEFIGVYRENSVRISGRILNAKLTPGRYRIIVKPTADGSKAAYAPFTIVK